MLTRRSNSWSQASPALIETQSAHVARLAWSFCFARRMSLQHETSQRPASYWARCAQVWSLGRSSSMSACRTCSSPGRRAETSVRCRVTRRSRTWRRRSRKSQGHRSGCANLSIRADLSGLSNAGDVPMRNRNVSCVAASRRARIDRSARGRGPHLGALLSA